MYASEVLEPGDQHRANTVAIGLVIPMHGSAGLFGLSCLACAVLAAEGWNAAGGILGRRLRLSPIDGAGEATDVAERVTAHVRHERLDAVVGWHLSHVRRAITERLPRDVPYVYSALYEGDEPNSEVLLLGETPGRQIAPAMRWLVREFGIDRWALVGDDYLWPRGSARATRSFAHDLGLDIVEEVYVPLGQTDYTDVLDRLGRSTAQGVLMLLVGQDAVHFNRAFAAAGLDERLIRLSSLMDENMLLASGAEATGGLFSSAAYFDSLATEDALQLVGDYSARFGPEAPVLNSMGESCYEAITLLATMVQAAGSVRAEDLLRTAGAGAVGYQGPRGSTHLHGRQAIQPVHLARADGLSFEILAQL